MTCIYHTGEKRNIVKNFLRFDVICFGMPVSITLGKVKELIYNCKKISPFYFSIISLNDFLRSLTLKASNFVLNICSEYVLYFFIVTLKFWEI